MRMMGALEAKGGWCFQARHVRGVDNRLADGLTRWKEGQILEKLNAECPRIAWQVQELGTGEQLILFGDIAKGYAFGRVAASTQRTYEANWRIWVSWRSFIGNECWLRKDMGEMELVRK